MEWGETSKVKSEMGGKDKEKGELKDKVSVENNSIPASFEIV